MPGAVPKRRGFLLYRNCGATSIAPMKTRKKHAGGRPPLPVEDRRQHRITVFLRDAELAALETLAAKRDADLGAVARELLVAALRRAR